MLLLVALMAGCSGGQGDSEAKGVERVGKAVERGSEKVGGLAVSPQRGDGSYVVVDEVVLPTGGYVVVYADGDGAPGQRLGVSELLKPGKATGIEIKLDDDVESGDVLHAMLHAEDNGNKNFDFPKHDAPITHGGSIVEVPFKFTVK